jgi:hypothetical protein
LGTKLKLRLKEEREKQDKTDSKTKKRKKDGALKELSTHQKSRDAPSSRVG